MKGGSIRSVTSRGHSGYAESGGDIICAGVSAVMQTLETGLKDVLGVETDTVRDPKTPVMSLEWDGGGSEAQIIAKTAAKSLESIADSYPKYVKYREIRE
ncbi:MAG: ribosomal-processing cysteine protease Prp [Synergistaceae bacterium]|jgi:uncharacterized protein YsxB (DUF464 family)|nr:ribosomal-processing cysteine protease Prp [Synergistaceae bacterium]